jgi:DNA-binding PadR family transcriptional regulator
VDSNVGLQNIEDAYIVLRYSEVRYTASVPDSPLTAQAFHVLLALANRDQHGYGIMQDVAARTQDKIRLGAGTLYGLIKRLLEDGLIVEVRETKRPPKSEGDDRRRYYRLTSQGRRAAQAEVSRLSELLEQARAHGLVAKPN